MTICNKWVTYQPLTWHSNQIHAQTDVNLIRKYKQADLQARTAKISTNNLDKQDNPAIGSYKKSKNQQWCQVD